MAAADAAVHPDFDLVAHRLDNGRQRLNAGLRAVQLTPAMVADHDGVGAAQDCQLGVFYVLYAFEDEFAAPLRFHPGHIGPGQARVKLFIGPGCQRLHIADRFDVAHQVAKAMAARAGHA